ncbi:MAG TPA: hypothetical protein VN920_02360 [Pyrinomonadaceae bacterium]|nr:hypothetical protein [Pyrinomonadaceae bacterium]
MKTLLALGILAQLSFSYVSPVVQPQDDARASWQLAAFDIAANVQQTERALNAVATLTMNNVGRGAGTGLTLRINSKAKVNSVKVNGASAAFLTLADTRGNVQRLNITLSPPVAANASVRLAIDYRLPVESNTGLQAISPIGTQFLPAAPVSVADPTAGGWYPMLNTPLTIRGADTAPFKLRVEGANVISSGVETAQTGAVVYEQTLNGEPFFLQGEWDRNEGLGDGKGIVAFLPKGAPDDERKQADLMIGTAASARSFYAGLLGAAPDTTLRLVAVRRGAGFNDAGTVLIEWGAFRRAKLDAATAMLIAESVAHLWVGTQTPIRGEGVGVLREGLPRYLATLFLEKQFGRDAAEAELLRQRTAYASVAKRDAPLSRSSPLDDTYYSAVPNKSAMVWRLVERRLGRDVFMSTLRSSIQGKQSGVSLASLRTRLAEQGGTAFKAMLDQELDQPTDMNLMIGLPQQRANGWVAALRNVGSFDAVVSVTATTDRGEQVKVETTVPAQNFGEVVFKTMAKVVRVEIDPDKLYPQLDYTDDVIPRTRDVGEAMAEGRRLLGALDFAGTERVAKEILVATPRVQEARVLLARALLGENRIDEAEKLFRSTLDEALPTAATLAWANIGLGDIALRKGQAAEAARRFNDAVRADAEYAASLTARAERIKAESAIANSAPTLDESARAFLGQLDHTITNGTKAELDTRIVPGELVRFVGGVVGTKPEVWQTRVLRTEQLEDNLLAADVSINSKVLGKEQTATAVFILVRPRGAWRLAGIELFEAH